MEEGLRTARGALTAETAVPPSLRAGDWRREEEEAGWVTGGSGLTGAESMLALLRLLALSRSREDGGVGGAIGLSRLGLPLRKMSKGWPLHFG